MKKAGLIFIASAAAAMFILGPSLFVSYENTDGLTPLSKSGAVEISITQDGFVPKEITILEGTAVTWVNKRDAKSWPASDPHPTHTDYAHAPEGNCRGGFDACNALSSTEKFNFRFDTEGVWHYHDHLFPSHMGTVYVKDASQGISISKENFIEKLHALTHVWDQILLSHTDFKELPFGTQLQLLHSKPAAEAWKLLKDAYIVDSVAVGEAHELAHAVGNLAYQERGFEGIGICDPVMAYGCYHGVVEEFLLENGPESIPLAEKTCAELFASTVDARYVSCLHGIGHGLVSWTGLEVDPALALCDTIVSEARSNCYDGVFMEYHSNNTTKSAVDPADLWDICEILSLKYQESCAKYQIVEAHRVFNDDVNRLLEWCEQSHSEALSNVCTISSGRSIAIAYWEDPSTIIALCNRAITNESMNTCLISAAEELVFQKFSGWEKNTQVLCNFSTLIDETSTECFDRIEKLK